MSLLQHPRVYVPHGGVNKMDQVGTSPTCGQFLGRYQLGQKLGSGSFGNVYAIENYPDLVMKVAKMNTSECSQLRTEYSVYQKWQKQCSSQFLTRNNKIESTDVALVPRVVLYAELVQYAIMVLERLTNTIASLPAQMWLSQKQTCSEFGIKLVRGLQCLHEQCLFVHSDIKEANIMYKKNVNHLYMIDFGLAKQLGTQRSSPSTDHSLVTDVLPNNNSSEPKLSNQPAVFSGSKRFASLKVHSRKMAINAFDDIESLLYLLLFLYYGSNRIPWEHIHQQKNQSMSETLDLIGLEKQKYALFLCGKVDPKWATLLTYLWRNGSITNEIDYNLVIDLLHLS